MSKKILYAVIGGDKRQIYLLQKLLESGSSCITYGLNPEYLEQILSSSAGKCSFYQTVDTLSEAVASAEHILGPIPLERNGIVNCQEACSIAELLTYIKAGQSLFAGCIPSALMDLLTERDILCYDYMESEEISLYNSIATAEGMLAEAIVNYPYNLHKSNCLVIGYGRCGRTLADKLKGLGAHVTICARRTSVLSYADCLGYEGISMEHLGDLIQNYQLIFNTVPHQLLTRELLERLPSGSHIYDLASAPGGIDVNAAKDLGLATFSCLGLPGKYAPAASADALYDYIIKTPKQ